MDTKLPIIKIGKIKLREILRSDFVSLFRIGSNPNLCKYLNWGPYKKVNEALYVIDEIYLKRPDDGLPIGYAIEIDNLMRGVIEYHSYDKLSNSIEIGYFLEESYQGMGIMYKSLKEAIKVAFNDLLVDKIIISSLIDNLKSIKLIEKLDFKYEKEEMIEVVENIYKLGRYYSLYKNDFKGD